VRIAGIQGMLVRYFGGIMSERNGDKSRFGRQRRAKILRRLKKKETREKLGVAKAKKS
jgi:hypothetical protein